ncbi:zinc finger MYND domain-containing protein 10 homolog [Phlebotomus argentipes]|uniref:zinc finger MYND domain-containing protein 10 homolog n=1 Tax=Phlebotomus argentipes TaxID=94469 RepID=UPI002892BA47|nr:zinc finger MYND domain-containing protein 10 homolog [Phlebotomus argentipes]
MCEAQNVIFPEEVEYHVKSLRKYQISDIGKTAWFEYHEILVKIHQQSILEASQSREEVLKDALLLEGKCKTLVYNAYVILVWRHKILPELLIRAHPQSSFIFYTIFFHEATTVGLLETLLFHPDACEALEETSLDLIDYCLQAIIQLIPLAQENHADCEEADASSVAEEVEKHRKSLQLSIGIRCLTILSFLVDNLDRICLSAVTRLLDIHDTPCVLSEILHLRPWMRRQGHTFQHFINDRWQSVAGEEISRVTKSEAHTWFCLRELLLNPRLFASYHVNNFRQTEISKVQGLLNDVLLDQLPPLADLKHFLVTFSVAKNPETQQRDKKLLLEELPQIRETLLSHLSSHGVENIIDDFQKSINITEIASTLSKAYNLDALEQLLPPESPSFTPSCHHCGLPAPKKCSKCLRVHYCSRDCQVKDWQTHKSHCQP